MSATILILEDDAVLRNLLGEVLHDEGYEVVAADTLPQLLHTLPRDADVLITDLLLDFDLVGLQAIEQVRATMNSKLPVLICTAADKQVEQLQPEIARLGAHILAKPFTIDELVESVKRALRSTPVIAQPARLPLQTAFA